MYAAFESYDYDAYYSKIKELFRDKKIVVFSGIGVLDKLEYDVFEYAKTKEYVFGPRINAFDKYDALLEQARLVHREKIIVFILGPCSKVLVNELSKDGYMAWDLGHLAKDYDMYMRGIEKTRKTITEFVKPD